VDQRSWGQITGLLIVALLVLAALPDLAAAHGPVDPVASSYQARVSFAPAGLEAKVIDGDQRMWLRVPPAATAVVLDYGGAPYLRFSPAGVQVNQNSAMYYLNQTPAQSPPSGLTRATPPRWQRIGGGHAYGWHDGRLHALATVALTPGSSYVGRWRVPVSVAGGVSAISGTVWHADRPSIVWFWPLVVLLACLLAAWRLRRPGLDARVARGLAVTALLAIAVAGAGRELHGRPTVSVGQYLLLAVILAFVAWMLRRVLWQVPGYFAYFVIAFVAIWAGIELFSTLLDGFVLLAVPGFVARAATVGCLGCGAGLLLLVFRLAERPARRSDSHEAQRESYA
jgi:hypothetical protein